MPSPKVRWAFLFTLAVGYAISLASGWWFHPLVSMAIAGALAFLLFLREGSDAFDAVLASKQAEVVFWTLVLIFWIWYFANLNTDPDDLRSGRW